MGWILFFAMDYPIRRSTYQPRCDDAAAAAKVRALRGLIGKPMFLKGFVPGVVWCYPSKVVHAHTTSSRTLAAFTQITRLI
eukprot:m.256393 g.256393  ORF g.256393 m.256393 type:complete len:81 (-) comp26570_c0_seq15:1564-1806(-)